MKKSALAALTALGLSAGAVQAAPFTLDYVDPNDPFGDDQLFSRVSIVSEVYTGRYRAGQFSFAVDGLENILAFCIEVTQGLRDGHLYENTPNLFDQAVVTNIDRLFNSAYDSVVDGISAAGFQVALWEIVEDTANGFDLDSGDFYTVVEPDFFASDTAVRQTAQGFLDGLPGATTGAFELGLLGSPTSQDVVTATRVSGGTNGQSTTPSPVPLPASGLLLLSAGLMLVRRKAKPQV